MQRKPQAPDPSSPCSSFHSGSAPGSGKMPGRSLIANRLCQLTPEWQGPVPLLKNKPLFLSWAGIAPQFCKRVGAWGICDLQDRMQAQSGEPTLCQQPKSARFSSRLQRVFVLVGQAALGILEGVTHARVVLQPRFQQQSTGRYRAFSFWAFGRDRNLKHCCFPRGKLPLGICSGTRR